MEVLDGQIFVYILGLWTTPNLRSRLCVSWDITPDRIKWRRTSIDGINCINLSIQCFIPFWSTPGSHETIWPPSAHPYVTTNRISPFRAVTSSQIDRLSFSFQTQMHRHAFPKHARFSGSRIRPNVKTQCDSSQRVAYSQDAGPGGGVAPSIEQVCCVSSHPSAHTEWDTDTKDPLYSWWRSRDEAFNHHLYTYVVVVLVKPYRMMTVGWVAFLGTFPRGRF